MTDPSYKALLIGNSTYPADPQNLQPLEGPVNDIALLRAALTHPDTGLLEPTAVRLLPERTMSEILVELERFFSTARRDDQLILYYSGHGLLDESNTLHLAARDSRTDLLRSTTVSAADINAMIDGSAAGTTVIVLDCCYSGSFKSGQLPDSLKGSGRYLLTSCRGGQLANDANRENGTSMFTQHLVEGMVDGAVDADHDGYVDLSDLYDFVYGRLSATGRQLPQRNFSGGGDIVIARRLPAVVTPPAPPDGPGAGGDAGPRLPAPAEPVLELSTTVIDLRDVGAGEVLPAERVYVRAPAGTRWDVETEADWVAVDRRDDCIALELRPRPGVNRANVVVREPTSGATQVVRVRVEVNEPAPPAPPPPPPPPPDRPGPSADAGTGAGSRRAGPSPALLVGGGLLALLLLLAALAAVGGGGDEGGGDDDTATELTEGLEPVEEHVTVPSTEDWTDTGIDLAAGETVEIVAEGEISHDAGRSYVGPDGEADRPDLDRANRVRGTGHGGLVARIDDGRPFFVGSYYESSDLDGRLYLGVNDVGVDNNRGEFQVIVRVG